MKSSPVKPTHITKGNVFDDLRFSPSQALELKIKSDLWLALREEIERHRILSATFAAFSMSTSLRSAICSMDGLRR